MLASLEWLKQYVDINISVAELCDKNYPCWLGG